MKQRGGSRTRHRNGSRQIELNKILLPHHAAAAAKRHFHETRGTFQTYCDMPEFGKRLEVTSRPAAKIKHRERRVAPSMYYNSASCSLTS
jgi:hypothetical protein